MTTYTATAYGHTFRKNSKRTYTHAVIGKYPSGGYSENWAGSEALAQKAARYIASCPANCTGYVEQVAIVPATAI
jgi:hypothetical protein